MPSDETSRSCISSALDPDGKSDAKVASALKKAWTIRERIVKATQEQQKLQSEQSILQSASDQTRQTFKSLQRNTGVDDLRKQLSERLIQLDSRLAEVTKRAYALAGARDPLTKQETVKPGLSLNAYRAFTRLAAPFTPLLLGWRTRRGKEERERSSERYGLASAPRPNGFLVWFHAASVGELNAALPVIDAIAAERPDVRVLLTTATVTSAGLARARLPRGQYVSVHNLSGGVQQVDRTFQLYPVDDDLDGFAVPDLPDRASGQSLGGDMTDAGAGGNAAEPRVGDDGDVLAEIEVLER